MKSTQWYLHVVGAGGETGGAENMLTQFVGQLRDQGLKINEVKLIDGELHPDLGNIRSGENGWTMLVYGEGDVSQAYSLFPAFLKQFKDAGINVLDSGIAAGTLRDISVPA